jgi:hypothetical protein
MYKDKELATVRGIMLCLPGEILAMIRTQFPKLFTKMYKAVKKISDPEAAAFMDFLDARLKEKC